MFCVSVGDWFDGLINLFITIRIFFFLFQILLKTEKYTRWSVYAFGTQCLVCTLTFLLVPIIHNIQNNSSIYNITSRLEIMVHLWLPIDYEYNFIYWAIMQVAITYCVTLGICMIVVFDVMNVAFLYHLIGHIEILKHILKNDFKEKMTQDSIKLKLIEVTRYYQFIRRQEFFIKLGRLLTSS